MELKDRVVSGFFWHSAERFGAMAVQAVISILLARLLTPADFGLVAMLVVFSAVAQGVVDSGFSQALIRKKDASQLEYASVFYINVALSLLLYLLLLLAMGPIARFYEQPELTRYAPVLFAVIPVNAFGVVQNAVIFREMRFRVSAAINLTATIVTGVVAVAMAYTGFGIWALVFQIVGKEAVRVAMMWIWNRWLPGLRFSFGAVRELFAFGSKLMLAGIITQLSNNVAQLFIGKAYSASSLGLYYQAQKLRDMFSLTTSQAILNVSYPAFARLQDERDKLREASRKIIVAMSFVLFPVLMGLIGVAEGFFALVLGQQWMGAVPYFQIFCLSALFLPGSLVAFNILRARGRSDQVLKLDIFKRLAMLVMVAVAVFISVMAVVWAMLLFAVLDMVVNLIYANRQTGYTFRQFARDSVPYLLMSVVMLGCVWAAGLLSPFMAPWLLLCLKIAVGAGVYILLARFFKTEAWMDMDIIVRQYRDKFRSK